MFWVLKNAGGMISTHALLAEGDRRHPRTRAAGSYFNPRPPCGGRPQHRDCYPRREHISTHALLAEGDPVILLSLRVEIKFQPTPSLRRATLRPIQHRPARQEFQPTPSLRRATANLNNSTNCYLFKFARFVCSSRHMLSLKFQRYP